MLHIYITKTSHWRDPEGNVEPQFLCNNTSQTATEDHNLFCVFQAFVETNTLLPYF